MVVSTSEIKRDRGQLRVLQTNGEPPGFPRGPAAGTARASLPALQRVGALVVAILVAEQLSLNRLPLDGGGRVRAMFGPSSLNQRAFVLAQAEDTGLESQRVPHLFDELEALTDGHAFKLEGWIFHGPESVGQIVP